MGGMMGHGMMSSGMMGGMGAWMLLWALVGLAILGALVTGAVQLARRSEAFEHKSEGAARLSDDRHDPVQILKRRYAAGEIEDDEYERRLYELALH